MSWHKIVFPFSTEINPDVVEIGKLAWASYLRENKPEGFAMFHATEGNEYDGNEHFLVYLSPVATEICTEVKEKYTIEPCDVPARDEPNAAFVFGDPKMMAVLQDSYEVKLANAAAAAAEAEAAAAANSAT